MGGMLGSMEGADIRFPHIGIEIQNLERYFSVFGYPIAYYGLIITLGMLSGYFMAAWTAKRTNQDKELYLDFALYAILMAVIGARIYYVIFAWDSYKDNLIQIFNLRAGGLAIYGGIIGGVLTAVVYAKVKKISLPLLLDTACIGLITGQIIGRWGNFVNKEAFGGYTDNFFAMQLKLSEVQSNYITDELRQHIINIDGTEYIQVHPTFLYESVWNLCILIFLIFYTKRKKFHGEIFCLYLLGYGIGRIWIESLRTDQLKLPGTSIPVSQLLSICLVMIALVTIILNLSKKSSAS
jgi:phosphatidylglycerol:prolipoprotein diacylglycerol transferase